MNELALGVNIIKCKEDLNKAGLQKSFSKAMLRISIQEIPKTLPHGPLDQTVVAVPET